MKQAAKDERLTIGFELMSDDNLTRSAQSPQDMTMLRVWVVLINNVIGIGLLSIPYCFRSGIISNTLILLFTGFMSFLSFVLLVDIALATGMQVNYPKFMGLASTTRIEWIPNFLIFLAFFGVGILHLQYTYGLVAATLDEINDYKPIPTWVYNRWLWILGLALVVCLPLTFIRTISKFSKVSMGTFVLIVSYLIHSAFYLIKAIAQQQFDPQHEIKWISFNKYFMSAIAMESFAFHCHPAVGPTLHRLINPTRRRQYIVLGAVAIGAFVTYFLGGLLPYLTLFDGITDPLILQCYPDGQVFTIVMKAVYGLFLLATAPLLLFSGRIYLAPLLCQKGEPGWQWDVMGIGMLLASALMAVLVTKIETMFNFVGGISVPTTLYLMPAVFYLRICKNTSKWKTVVAWFFLPLGFGTMGLSLYHTIDELIHG
jgi:amino acid permease